MCGGTAEERDAPPCPQHAFGQNGGRDSHRLGVEEFPCHTGSDGAVLGGDGDHGLEAVHQGRPFGQPVRGAGECGRRVDHFSVGAERLECAELPPGVRVRRR